MAQRRSRKIVDETGDESNSIALPAMSSASTSASSPPATPRRASHDSNNHGSHSATHSSPAGKVKRRVKGAKKTRSDSDESGGEEANTKTAADLTKSPRRKTSTTSSTTTTGVVNTALSLSQSSPFRTRVPIVSPTDADRMEKAALKMPVDVDAILAWADYLWNVKKNIPAARDQIQNAVTFDPSNPRALIRFAEIQAYENNDVAAEFVEKTLAAVGESPKAVQDADVLNRCGLFFESQSQFERAKVGVTSVVALCSRTQQ
jgi:hypothetical protein